MLQKFINVAKNSQMPVAPSVVIGGARAQRVGRKVWDAAFNCQEPAKEVYLFCDSMRPKNVVVVSMKRARFLNISNIWLFKIIYLIDVSSHSIFSYFTLQVFLFLFLYLNEYIN